jgi:hypothetical protein
MVNSRFKLAYTLGDLFVVVALVKSSIVTAPTLCEPTTVSSGSRKTKADLRGASKVPAILDVWYPGTQGGAAVANLLFGSAVPGGSRHHVICVVLLRGSRVIQIGTAPAFDGLHAAKQWDRLNTSNGAAGGKCDGDGSRRYTLRKFGDHQEIIIPGREKGGMNGPAEILNGDPDGIEAILRVTNECVPGVRGVADLMAVIRHLTLLSQ